MTWGAAPPPMDALASALNDPSNPIGMRMRAAYHLRQAYERSKERRQAGDVDDNDHDDEEESTSSLEGTVVDILGTNLRRPAHGSLMRHEFAYVMGQLRDPRCCPHLEAVLSDGGDDVMVRHECAEALGAVGARRSVGLLVRLAGEDPNPEVHETCRIAVDFVNWRLSQSQSRHPPTAPTGAIADEKKDASSPSDDGAAAATMPPVVACPCMLSPYSSIDPAPPLFDAGVTEAELGRMLRDPTSPLFERYRAMFALRNLNTAASALELGNALVTDDAGGTTALLRHEVAYVLGQMQNAAAVPMLVRSLRDRGEHVMVRHESAEALGAMCDDPGAWGECERVLREFADDEGDHVAVRESCLVALDAADYWGSASSSGDPPGGGDRDGEEGVGGASSMSFAAQKSIVGGGSAEGSVTSSTASLLHVPAATGTRAALANHFNVAN